LKFKIENFKLKTCRNEREFEPREALSFVIPIRAAERNLLEAAVFGSVSRRAGFAFKFQF